MESLKRFLFIYRYPLALAVLPLLVFWRNLLPIPGRVFFGNDSILSFYTLASMVHQLVRGIVPLWDPHTFFGVPLITRPDSLVFYLPLGMVVAVSALLHLSDTSIYVFMELVTILHFSLAGVGVYFFLRRQKLSEFPSFVGGLIYMLNGGMVAFANTTGLLISISYLPWVLLCFDWLVSKPNLKRALIFGLVFAQPVLTFAWTSSIVYSLILLFFYFWYLYFTHEINGFWVTLRYLMLGFIVSVLLSAVVVLPGLEVPFVSNRANIDYSRSAYGGNLRPRQLFDFVMPYLTAKNYGEKEVLHLYHETLTYTYVGIAALLLLFPAFFIRRRRRNFYAVSLIFSLLFLLGGAAPVFDVFYLLFYPLMKPFSEARLASYIPQFFLAVLAAMGLENILIQDGLVRKKIIAYRRTLLRFLKLLILVFLIIFFRLDQLLWNSLPSEEITDPIFSQQNVFILFLIFFGATTLVFFLRDLKKQTFLKIALFLTIFFDLFLYAEKYPINTIGIDPQKLFAKNSVVSFLSGDSASTFYRSDVRELPANYASGLLGINHIVGYLVYLPKIPYDFYSLISENPRNLLVDRIASIRYYPTESVLDEKGYDLVFQKTVTSDNQSGYYHLGGGPPTGWVPVPVGTTIRVYENKAYNLYPRLVSQVETVSDAQAQDLLRGQAFDPEDTVLVSAETPVVIQNLSNETFRKGETKVVDLPGKNYQKNFLTKDPGQSVLVTSLPFYSDWQVKIDGRSAKVLRVNLSFMGVFLPSGQHLVSFYYVPRTFYLGLVVSLVSTLAIFLILVSGAVFLFLRLSRG